MRATMYQEVKGKSNSQWPAHRPTGHCVRYVLYCSPRWRKKVKCIDSKKESDSQPQDIKRVNSEKKKQQFYLSHRCPSDQPWCYLNPNRRSEARNMKRAQRTDSRTRDSTEQAWGDLLFSHHYSQFHQILPSQICRMSDGTSKWSNYIKPKWQTFNRSNTKYEI